MPAQKGTGGRLKAVNSAAGKKETSKNISTGVQKKIMFQNILFGAPKYPVWCSKI